MSLFDLFKICVGIDVKRNIDFDKIKKISDEKGKKVLDRYYKSEDEQECIPLEQIKCSTEYSITVIKAINMLPVFCGEQFQLVLNAIERLTSKKLSNFETIKASVEYLDRAIDGIEDEDVLYNKIGNDPESFLFIEHDGKTLFSSETSKEWYTYFFMFTFINEIKEIIHLKDLRFIKIFGDPDKIHGDKTEAFRKMKSFDFCFKNGSDESVSKLQKEKFQTVLNDIQYTAYTKITENLKHMEISYRNIKSDDNRIIMDPFEYNPCYALESFKILCPEKDFKYLNIDDFCFPFTIKGNTLILDKKYDETKRTPFNVIDTFVHKDLCNMKYPKISIDKILESTDGLRMCESNGDFVLYDESTSFTISTNIMKQIFHLFTKNPIINFLPDKFWYMIIIYMIIIRDFQFMLKKLL